MLTVNDLGYQYGANPVLENVSFQIPEASLAALVGRNGSGKSTLLRCLAGWMVPTRGTIEVNGKSPFRGEKQYREQVIFVPDTPDFYDELTAWDHLQLVSQLYRIENWQERSRELLKQFQLYESRLAFPFTFSRGMRYKLALCMAFVVAPPLLLLDEPFGPLDSLISRHLWHMLRDYCADGKTVLFSSHVLSDAGHPDIFVVLREQHASVLDGAQVSTLAGVLDDE